MYDVVQLLNKLPEDVVSADSSRDFISRLNSVCVSFLANVNVNAICRRPSIYRLWSVVCRLETERTKDRQTDRHARTNFLTRGKSTKPILCVSVSVNK